MWYTILFIISSVLLVGQVILSLVHGDFDMATDLDISDFLSFKGILHFLFGFSLTLVIAPVISLFWYTLSVLIGLCFIVLLAYIYKWTYNLKQEMTYTDEINEQIAKIYIYSKDLYSGICIYNAPEGQIEIPFTNNSGINLKSDDYITIFGNREMVHVINKLTKI